MVVLILYLDDPGILSAGFPFELVPADLIRKERKSSVGYFFKVLPLAPCFILFPPAFHAVLGTFDFVAPVLLVPSTFFVLILACM
jgi:hypothetical protein